MKVKRVDFIHTVEFVGTFLDYAKKDCIATSYIKAATLEDAEKLEKVIIIS